MKTINVCMCDVIVTRAFVGLPLCILSFLCLIVSLLWQINVRRQIFIETVSLIQLVVRLASKRVQALVFAKLTNEAGSIFRFHDALV